MLSKRVVLLVVALCCLLALTPSALLAQAASTGTVAGTVTDPSGAAVAGAGVTLVDPSTNDSRKTTTNETGRYLFANVPPGTYNLTINKTGFRVTKFSGQVVTVGSALTLNATMELGSVSQVVEVTAANSECHGGQLSLGRSLNVIAVDRPGHQHVRDTSAGRLSRWQRGRCRSGPEYLLTRWRSEHQ